MASLFGDFSQEATLPGTTSTTSTSRGNGTGGESGWQSSVSLNYPLGMMIVVAILLFVVIIGTATGNLFVVIALIRYRNLRTVSNYLIGNLAVSDFLLATTIFPLSTFNECLGYWVFGQTACEIWLTLDVLYCTASIWNLCVIAFDRFTATVYPVWYRGRRSAERQAAVYAVVVWCVATVICVPPLLGWKDAASGNYKYDEVNGVYACMLFQTRGYVIYSASGSFFVPLVVTLFFYTSIFIVIHGRMRKTKAAKAANKAMSRTAAATSSELKPLEAGKSGVSTTLTVADVEMSSMSVSNVELCVDDVVQSEEANMDVELEPNVATSSDRVTTDPEDREAEKRRLLVPTIVVKVESEPSRTLVVDAGENGCPSRFGLLRAEPDPDTISIGPDSTKRERRLSFLAVKNAISSLQKGPDSAAARLQRSFEKREMRATVRMAIIISFFCGFWLGFFVVYVVHGCCPDCYVPRELDAFFFWLGYSNSSVNPILYTIFNDEFRRAFLRILGYKSTGARKQ